MNWSEWAGLILFAGLVLAELERIREAIGAVSKKPAPFDDRVPGLIGLAIDRLDRANETLDDLRDNQRELATRTQEIEDAVSSRAADPAGRPRLSSQIDVLVDETTEARRLLERIVTNSGG